MSGNTRQATSGRRRPGQGTRRTDTAVRDLEALALRRAGQTYDTIAAQMGYADRSAAWKAVERALEAAKHEAAGAAVALELARLDEMLAAVYPGAILGNPQMIATVLRLMERRAKYLDLDNVTDLPTDPVTSIETAIARMDSPDGLERLAKLHVDAAHGLFSALLRNIDEPREGVISPRWTTTVLSALISASLSTLKQEEGMDGS